MWNLKREAQRHCEVFLLKALRYDSLELKTNVITKLRIKFFGKRCETDYSCEKKNKKEKSQWSSY